MKRFYILCSVLAIANTLLAADYYVSPAGSGVKDGSTAENAFDVDGFRTQIVQAENGDAFYLAAGIYDLSEGTITVDGTKSVLIAGASGQERTVFSGDSNDNGIADEGDASCLVEVVSPSTEAGARIDIENIDFTCTYRGADMTADVQSAIVITATTDLRVSKCNFYGNVSAGAYNPSAAAVAGTAKFTDCTFTDNLSQGCGGPVYAADVQNEAVVTFERCVINDNNLSDAIDDDLHVNGSALIVNGCKAVNLINSTITSNTADALMGAVTVAPGCRLNVIGCTISGNEAVVDGPQTRDAIAYGIGQVSLYPGAQFYVVNSIICGDSFSAAIYGKEFEAAQTDDAVVVSGGYNSIGAVEGLAAEWLASDKIDETYSHVVYFGQDGLDSRNVLVPIIYKDGISNSAARSFTKDFGLPSTVDLTIDQVGTERDGDDFVTNGAYAATKDEVNAKAATGLETIGLIEEAGLVKTGAYTYKLVEESGTVAIVNLTGAVVALSDADNIDLTNFSSGVYIVKGAQSVFKVVR